MAENGQRQLELEVKQAMVSFYVTNYIKARNTKTIILKTERNKCMFEVLVIHESEKSVMPIQAIVSYRYPNNSGGFKYTFISFIDTGTHEPNKMTCFAELSDFIAQLVKQCTGVTEVMGSNSGTRFSKVPKLYGPFCISRTDLKNGGFLFVTLKTCQRIGFPKQAVASFINGFSGPKRYRDFRETGHRCGIFETYNSKSSSLQIISIQSSSREI